VDWISDLLEAQTDPEFDICRAYSAAEALGWLNRAKIDILITDIRMPKMNGIELAEKVREDWPQCKVLMLTAYSEFDYAYDAIKSNVVSYILKDEEDSHILAEVRKAVNLLNNELSSLKLLDDMREQLKDSTSAIQNELVLSLLKGDQGNLKGIFGQLESIGVNVNKDTPILLLAGRLENVEADYTVVERFRLAVAVKKLVAHYMGNHFRCHAVEDGNSRMVWLIQSNAEGGLNANAAQTVENAIVFAGGALETIQQASMETLGLRISFALHGALVTGSQIPDAFRLLDGILDLQTDQIGFIITTTCPANAASVMQPVEPEGSETRMNVNLTEKIERFLATNRLVDFQQTLEIICKKIESCTSWHNNTALELYYATAVAVVSYINRRKLAEKIAFKTGLNGLFRPYDAGSWKNAVNYLRQLSAAISELQREGAGQLSNNIIQVLKNYIDSHITEDISLVRLSEVTGYNTTYLSHLFRENTGIRLNDYIGRRKLIKIEELMSDEKLNIGDIASKAGFESRTYFNNFLRRMKGMSPQEYRAHLRQSQKK
jgi:two-component system response regulator YesN